MTRVQGWLLWLHGLPETAACYRVLSRSLGCSEFSPSKNTVLEVQHSGTALTPAWTKHWILSTAPQGEKKWQNEMKERKGTVLPYNDWWPCCCFQGSLPPSPSPNHGPLDHYQCLRLNLSPRSKQVPGEELIQQFPCWEAESRKYSTCAERTVWNQRKQTCLALALIFVIYIMWKGFGKWQTSWKLVAIITGHTTTHLPFISLARPKRTKGYSGPSSFWLISTAQLLFFPF